MLKFRLGNLLRFSQEREGVEPQEVVKRGRKRFSRPWSMFRVQEEDIERLKSLASSATRLENLQSTEGWNDIVDAKLYYQSLHDNVTKNPNLDEKVRFRAACEWATLDGFFREISNRIRRGREAREKLERLVKKES